MKTAHTGWTQMPSFDHAATPAAEDLYPTRGDTVARLPRRDPVVYGAARRDAPSGVTLRRFDRDGFVLLPGAFVERECERMLRAAESLSAAAMRNPPETAFFEPDGRALRSMFAVHEQAEEFARACEAPGVLDLVSQILGDDVYVHQSRLNYKPAFSGAQFFWHSDFETWHAEDGMPRMRAVSVSLSLTPSLTSNGPLMLIPGSHRTFVSCPGRTPRNHYQQSLVQQRLGTPDEATLTHMATRRGIKVATGATGTAALFDCNTMHASTGNITPFARTNLFVVYNAVSNRLRAPYCGQPPRPEFVAARDHCTVLPARRVA